MSNKKSYQDEQREQRLARLAAYSNGTLVIKPVARRRIDDREIRPILDGIGNRSAGADGRLRVPWLIPSERAIQFNDAGRVQDPKGAATKLAQNADYIGTYYGWNGTMRPEYDMLEPFVLFDTEAYLKQAINRKLSLMFRNGYEVVSEQNRLSAYIKNRMDAMEYVMNRPMREFFQSILYNLSLCSNCFLLKIRDDKGSPGTKTENNKRTPIAGYAIIPAHTIFPYLEMGQIIKWRRIFDTGQPYIDYPLYDIVHLKWDVKPGHIYGTPRTVAVKDDIFALRRLEENIELLFMNHLFPLFHVKVGTPEAPCTYYDDGSSEIDLVRQQIQTMPKEGVFVTDERAEVTAVGAEGKSLETKELITHLKGRVYTGLGMSPLDMGEGDTANRSTADNISQVLKDSVKNDLESFGGQIRMFLFKDWFAETTMSISMQGAVAETKLSFHEIDMDNKIKEENHTIEKYNNNMVSHDEARKEMRRKPMEKAELKGTHHEMQVKDLETHKAKVQTESQKELIEHETGQQKQLLTHQTKEGAKQAETQVALNKSEVETAHGKAAAEHKVASAKVKVLHARTRHAVALGKSPTAASKGAKSAHNKNRPANQHGKATGPTKAKSAQEILELIHDRLKVALELCDPGEPREWSSTSDMVIEGILREVEQEERDNATGDENSYTRHLRTQSDRLKSQVAAVSDVETLNVLLSNFLTDSQDESDDNQSGLCTDSHGGSGVSQDTHPGAGGERHGEDAPGGSDRQSAASAAVSSQQDSLVEPLREEVDGPLVGDEGSVDVPSLAG